MKIKCSRCLWSPLYEAYHDNERWVPVHDDRVLFEFLVLEGAQAGLSRITVLKKREGYRKVFHEFNPDICAQLTDAYLESLRENPEIIRNKLKIFSVRKNARVFLTIQQEFWSFSDYLWWWVWGKQIVNTWKTLDEVPATTELSGMISKDLKKKGMSFVWSTIVYAYMQAVGVVDDHVESCWKKSKR